METCFSHIFNEWLDEWPIVVITRFVGYSILPDVTFLRFVKFGGVLIPFAVIVCGRIGHFRTQSTMFRCRYECVSMTRMTSQLYGTVHNEFDIDQ